MSINLKTGKLCALATLCLMLRLIAIAQQSSLSAPGRDNARPSPQSEAPLVQELFISETVSTQERHEVQATIGAQLYRQTGTTLVQSLFKVEYGISNRLQVESEVSIEHVRGLDPDFNTGPQDVSVAIRYAFLRRSRRFRFTGGLGLNFLSPENRAVRLEPSIVGATNVGKAQFQVGAAMTLTGLREHQYTLAAVYPVRRWRPILEFKLEEAGEEVGSIIAVGLIRNVHGFEIGIASPIRLTGFGPRVTPMFLITHEFGREDE